MNKSVSTTGKCPARNLLEAAVLRESAGGEESIEMLRHAETCRKCRAVVESLRIFYRCVDEELKKPIENRVFDLAKSVRSDVVEYGLLICESSKGPSSGQGRRLYKAKMVFCANGSRFGEKEKLGDYGLNELGEGSIAIRAMSDTVQNKLLLYLWSKQSSSWEGQRLRIEGKEENIAITAAGQAAIPLCRISDLDGRSICFEEEQIG